MSSGINILYFEPSSGASGSANALAGIINNLNRDKFTPIVIINNYGPKIAKIKNAKIAKLGEIRNKTKSSVINLFLFIFILFSKTIQTWKIIHKKSVSLVHINTNITSGIPAILAAKLSNIPCICHIRETRKLIKREKIFAKLVDKFIVLNNDAYEIYKQDIPPERIKVIYDGVDLDEFNETGKNSFKNEFQLDSLPLIGTAGRIIEGKGQKEFIAAAEIVLKQSSKLRFIVTGDGIGSNGKYYQDAQNLVKKANLTENIIFTGWRKDIKNMLSALDIFVFTSTSFPEGLPNIILEAMALNKAVIATNIPGPRDILVDGKTGFLIPPGNINAMAEKIIYLLDNPDIAKKIGVAGRKRTEEMFDIKKQVKKNEALYSELLTKNV